MRGERWAGRGDNNNNSVRKGVTGYGQPENQWMREWRASGREEAAADLPTGEGAFPELNCKPFRKHVWPQKSSRGRIDFGRANIIVGSARIRFKGKQKWWAFANKSNGGGQNTRTDGQCIEYSHGEHWWRDELPTFTVLAKAREERSHDLTGAGGSMNDEGREGKGRGPLIYRWSTELPAAAMRDRNASSTGQINFDRVHFSSDTSLIHSKIQIFRPNNLVRYLSLIMN